MWICTLCRRRRASADGQCIIIFCVRLLQVCSFDEDGQYQSLDEWNEQRYGSHVFSFYIVNQSPRQGAMQAFYYLMKHIRLYAVAFVLVVTCFVGIETFAQLSGRSPEQKKTFIQYISSKIKENEAAMLLFTQSELSAAINKFGDSKSIEFYPLGTYYFYTGAINVYNSMSIIIYYTDDILSIFGVNTAVFRNFDSDHNRQYVFIKNGTTTLYTLVKKSNGHFDLVENSYINGDQLSSTRYTDDYGYQQQHYEANAPYAPSGLNFITDLDSPSSSSTRNKSNSHRSSKANCPYCNGTGVTKSQSSGGNMSSHVAYYNSPGNKCPYCGYSNKHYHTKCLH